MASDDQDPTPPRRKAAGTKAPKAGTAGKAPRGKAAGSGETPATRARPSAAGAVKAPRGAKAPRRAAAAKPAEAEAQVEAEAELTPAPSSAAESPGKVRGEGRRTRAPRTAVPDAEEGPPAPAPEPAATAAMPATGEGSPEVATPPAGGAPAVPTATPSSPEKRAEVEQVLGELLRLSGFEARLELADVPDGSVSVAIHFAELPAGVQAGRRTPFMEALQFIANKLANKPGTAERRWVALGAQGHPPPRQAPKAKAAKGPVPPPPATPSPATAAQPAQGTGAVAHGGKPGRAGKAGEPDERTLEVTPDPALAAEAQRLAEASARYGRFYALLPLTVEDRARMVQASAQVPGVRVSCEGEGRHRRVVFRPDTPQPLPRRTLPDYDEDDEEADALGA